MRGTGGGTIANQAQANALARATATEWLITAATVIVASAITGGIYLVGTIIIQ